MFGKAMFGKLRRFFRRKKPVEKKRTRPSRDQLAGLRYDRAISTAGPLEGKVLEIKSLERSLSRELSGGKLPKLETIRGLEKAIEEAKKLLMQNERDWKSVYRNRDKNGEVYDIDERRGILGEIAGLKRIFKECEEELAQLKSQLGLS